MAIFGMSDGWLDYSTEGPYHTYLQKEEWTVFRAIGQDDYSCWQGRDGRRESLSFASEKEAVRYVNRQVRTSHGEPPVLVSDFSDPSPGPRTNLNEPGEMLSASRVRELADYASCYGEFSVNTPVGTISRDAPDVVFTAEMRAALRAWLTVLGILRTPV